MTKQEFDEKLNELINQIPNIIHKKADEYWRSGAFDANDYQDDFILPKAVICSAISEVKWQFHPLSKEGKELVKNLEKF